MVETNRQRDALRLLTKIKEIASQNSSGWGVAFNYTVPGQVAIVQEKFRPQENLFLFEDDPRFDLRAGERFIPLFNVSDSTWNMDLGYALLDVIYSAPAGTLFQFDSGSGSTSEDSGYGATFTVHEPDALCDFIKTRLDGVMMQLDYICQKVGKEA